MKNHSQVKKCTCACMLSRRLFDPDATKIYERLSQHRYTTYFVGGCVRDLLLNSRPKDFDIVTSARPRQIRKLFRNSRIIGKRFRLVHVLCGEKIVEVATFRGAPEDEPESAILKRDNEYGTDAEDAWRRDFTINALYYDLEKNVLIDYVGGVEDLFYRKIRTIGDPEARFPEDPVRILRAIKLAARLNFEIVPEAQQAIRRHVPLLKEVPRARLLLELLKILQEGASHRCFQYLADYGIFSIIAPDFQDLCDQENTFAGRLLTWLLHNLDRLPHHERHKLSEATLLAVLCLPLIATKKFFLHKKASALQCSRLSGVALRLGIPKRTAEKVENILRTQRYLEQRDGISSLRLKAVARNNYLTDSLAFWGIWREDGRRIGSLHQHYPKTSCER